MKKRLNKVFIMWILITLGFAPLQAYPHLEAQPMTEHFSSMNSPHDMGITDIKFTADKALGEVHCNGCCSVNCDLNSCVSQKCSVHSVQLLFMTELTFINPTNSTPLLSYKTDPTSRSAQAIFRPPIYSL